MFDRFIKFLYCLGWYFVGMTTFSYATQLSDILEDDNLFQICELGEKVLALRGHDLNELDNRFHQKELSSYCKWFLQNKDLYFEDCCYIFHFIKTFKNIPLIEEEETCALSSFIVGLDHLNDLINLFHVSMTYYGLTEEEHNFLASLDYYELIRKIRASRQDTPQQSSEPADVQQPQPTKTSCTFL